MASDYERQREQTILANQEMLASLGLGSSTGGASNMLNLGGSKRTASGRGLAPRKTVKRPAAPAVPSRKSSRQRGEQADNVYIESDRGHAVTVAGLPSGVNRLRQPVQATDLKNVASC